MELMNNKGGSMKKLIAGVFVLLVSTTYSESLSTNIKKNQTLINNLKIENENLKDEIIILKEKLSKFNIDFIKHINFKEQGVSMTRSKDSFSLIISADNLENTKYVDLLNNLVAAIKYEPLVTVSITGEESNKNFLKSYFLEKGIQEKKLLFPLPEYGETTIKPNDLPTTITLIINN